MPLGFRVPPGELSAALARCELLAAGSAAVRRPEKPAPDERVWRALEILNRDVQAAFKRELALELLVAPSKGYGAVVEWTGTEWRFDEYEFVDSDSDYWRLVRKARKLAGKPPWSTVRIVEAHGTLTTLKRLVAGLCAPVEGRVFSDGVELRALRALIAGRRVVGPLKCWVPGGAGLHDYHWLSVGGRKVAGHKLMHEYSFGPVPAGFVVRHKCDVRPCFKPAHLEVGTHDENMADMVERGRSRFRDRAERIAADERRLAEVV